MLVLLMGLLASGCSASVYVDRDVPEEPTTVCDVTKDLNHDGCYDAVCRMLVPRGGDLNGVPVTKDMVIETRYFGSCKNPQDLVLNPPCMDDPDVTEGDGCSVMTCQLPGGTATYICE